MIVEPSDSIVSKLLSGTAGALVSMKFLAGTWPEKICMAIGGSALSYFASVPVSEWMSVSEKAQGLVGFLIGLFGMAIISKVYEVIQVMDAKEIATGIWSWLKKKWGA